LANHEFPAIDYWLRRHRRVLATLVMGRMAKEYLNVRSMAMAHFGRDFDLNLDLNVGLNF
jgi:hypothetical protein